MSNVTMTRIVKPVVVTQAGKVCVESKVTTLFVKFTDRDGNNVSLAFDGRFDTEDIGAGVVCEHYMQYADCPVQFECDGTQSDVRDRSVVRALRDALNALNLDD